jgi:hypothetical protein
MCSALQRRLVAQNGLRLPSSVAQPGGRKAVREV